MPEQEVIIRNNTLIEQGTQFESMLKEWGLPSENIIANTDTTEVFIPKSKFEILFGKHYDDMTDFLVDKRLCQATSRSFLFSSLFELSSMYLAVSNALPKVLLYATSIVYPSIFFPAAIP